MLSALADGLETSDHISQRLTQRDNTMIEALETSTQEAIFEVPKLMEDIHSIEGLIQIGRRIRERRGKTN